MEQCSTWGGIWPPRPLSYSSSFPCLSSGLRGSQTLGESKWDRWAARCQADRPVEGRCQRPAPPFYPPPIFRSITVHC